MGPVRIAAGLAMALSAGIAQAAEGTGAEKAKPTAGADKVTVVSVTGVAQRRSAADPNGKWQPLKVGDVLDERTVVRTGLGAKAILQLADRGKVTIKAASKVGISEFQKSGGRLKARMGLKYGAMRSRIDSARGPNDFQINTAVATLSVRGTGLDAAYAGDFGLYAQCLYGNVEAANIQRKKYLSGNTGTDGNLTAHREMAEHRRDTKMGDAFGGLTYAERTNLARHGAGRGVFGFVGAGSNVTTLGGTARALATVADRTNGLVPIDQTPIVPIVVRDLVSTRTTLRDLIYGPGGWRSHLPRGPRRDNAAQQ